MSVFPGLDLIVQTRADLSAVMEMLHPHGELMFDEGWQRPGG